MLYVSVACLGLFSAFRIRIHSDTLHLAGSGSTNAVYFVNKASTILCSRQVKVTHTVYNRMGLLLKSLITVARVTPAYKLSRTQGQESYVICYR